MIRETLYGFPVLSYGPRDETLYFRYQRMLQIANLRWKNVRHVLAVPDVAILIEVIAKGFNYDEK